MRYERIVNYITDRPWAILEEKLHAIGDLIALRASGLTLTEQEVQARIGETREGSTQTEGAIAVVPIFGVMSHRMNMLSAYSGGTSTELLAAKIRQLAGDASIQAIVLDIDSEGGMVEGVPELWSTIYKARGEKRIIAVANAMAASAAYYVASAAEEIVATPSGSVGSIGVLHIHMEVSKAAEAAGIKYTITRAGEHKAELNPYEPLSDDAQEYIQGRVDEAYEMFVRDVAKGRGVKVAEVRKNYGQGRMLSAKNALEAGMIDRIATLDEVLSKLVGQQRKKAMRAEDTFHISVAPDDSIEWTISSERAGSLSSTTLDNGTMTTVAEEEKPKEVSTAAGTLERLRLKWKWRKKKRDLDKD